METIAEAGPRQGKSRSNRSAFSGQLSVHTKPARIVATTHENRPMGSTLSAAGSRTTCQISHREFRSLDLKSRIVALKLEH